MIKISDEASSGISERNNTDFNSERNQENLEIIEKCLQNKEEENKEQEGNKNCSSINENGEEKVSLIATVDLDSDDNSNAKLSIPLRKDNSLNGRRIIEKDKKMAYDDVILHMGEFGRYQRRIYLLLCLPAISCAFHKMSGVFLGAKPDFRCLMPHENPNNSTLNLHSDIMNISYPWDNATNTWSNCKRYDIEFENDNYTFFNKNLSFKPDVVKCESFVYDKSKYKLTTTSQWNLVCDRAWLRATGDSLFMVGVMVGSMIFGALSDRFGRRPIFFLSLVIQLVGGILVAVSPEYISYVIFRLILGSTTSGVFLVAYVIGHLAWFSFLNIPLEMVGPSKRLVAGVGCQLFFTSGYIMTAGFAYLITDWRYFQISITVPSLVFLIYWWFIPESARWLLTKGRAQEAKDILKKASTENGVDLSHDMLDDFLISYSNTRSDTKEPSLFDLFKYPNLRNKSILLFFNWFVNSGTYYGLSWNASNLGGNEYVNFVIGGLVEVPAYTFLLFTLNRWGRKVILCGCMLFAGVALLLTLFIPADKPWLITLLAMLGKLAITSSYGAVYVFTAEQFPTVIRNVGLGACSTFARVGGVIAPYINHLAEIWVPFPLVIFGSCSLIGGMMSLLLPETMNKKLPESIEDGEQFGKRIRKGKEDIGQLSDIAMTKPLKSQENGVHSNQNG